MDPITLDEFNNVLERGFSEIIAKDFERIIRELNEILTSEDDRMNLRKELIKTINEDLASFDDNYNPQEETIRMGLMMRSLFRAISLIYAQEAPIFYAAIELGNDITQDGVKEISRSLIKKRSGMIIEAKRKKTDLH
jgi:hypothetical protein